MRMLGMPVRLVIVVIAALIAVLVAAPNAATRNGAPIADPAGAPNIVLIVTDDQTVEDLVAMPQVRERLAATGVTFEEAFAPYPLCCPARATLLTGQYAHNHHVLGNQLPYGGFQRLDDRETLPVWLQRAGYDTVMLGKYLNGFPAAGEEGYIPPGWTDWRVPVAGIYNFWNYTLNVNGQPTAYENRYQTDVWQEHLDEIVDTYAGGEDPFFLWAGFLAPHNGGPDEPDDPATGLGTPAVAPEYRDAQAGLELPDKPSINEADVSDKPAHIRRAQLRNLAALTELYQQRRESLMSVDDAVGRLIDRLEAAGELDDTVFVFTSDNGYLVGEHRRVGKTIGYEESVRVPLLLSGPGIPSGVVRSQLVSQADIAPTILELAGASSRLVADGRSLLPFATGAARDRERAILLQAGPAGATDERWYTAIRTRSHVYVEFDTGEREFYDLGEDPLQLDSAHDDTRSRGVVRRLAARLGTLRDCAGESCW
jgi:N-acetylglucosamine-6-sulfatase